MLHDSVATLRLSALPSALYFVLSKLALDHLTSTAAHPAFHMTKCYCFVFHISVPIIHYSCHITEAEGEVGYRKTGLSPPHYFYYTGRSKAVLLLWLLTVTCSCCPYLYYGSAIMLVTYFVNFRCLNDHIFGKELFIRFTASAFRKLPSIYVFSYFPFCFEDRMWDLIISLPDHG